MTWPMPVTGMVRASAQTHYLVVPMCLFLVFFDPSILDPTVIGWAMDGDHLAQHYAGWLGFRFDEWRWPLGYTGLLAAPHGVPISFTDSNPLLSFLLKLMSPYLPEQFQYYGLWYLGCLGLAYYLVFNLLRRWASWWLPVIAASILIVTMPKFFFRIQHDTLMAHWLVIGALSVFLRDGRSWSSVFQYSGLMILSVLIHPYFLLMIAPIAGMDILRRLWRRALSAPTGSLPGAIAVSVAHATVLVVPAICVGAAIGLFDVRSTPQEVGVYSMDPLAWFNPMHMSQVLKSWTLGWGQYEGFQYLGLGLLAAVAGAAVLWTIGVGAPPRPMRSAMVWLAPAVVFLYLFAISPVVTAFGTTVLEFDLAGWPLVSTFRSSGRIAWPISYLIAIVALSVWLSVRTRRTAAVLAVLVGVQFADLIPLVQGARSATRPVETPFAVLRETERWRDLIAPARLIYVAPELDDHRLVSELGVLGFPRGTPVSRFGTAHDLLPERQRLAADERDQAVRAGLVSDDVLYVLAPMILRRWAAAGVGALDRLTVIDGLIVLPPATAPPQAPFPVALALAQQPGSLYGWADGCCEGCALVMAVRDDAQSRLSEDFVALIDGRGGTLGTLRFRGSYAAVMADGRMVTEAVGDGERVSVRAEVFGTEIVVTSAGNYVGNKSSIRINGIELSPNQRGFNAVMTTRDGVIAVGSFDTFADPTASAPTTRGAYYPN